MSVTFATVNDDILLYIFSFLPFKIRVKFERTCKRWRNILMKSYYDITKFSLHESAPSLTKLSDECVDIFFQRLSPSLIELHLDIPNRYVNENLLKSMKKCQKLTSLSMKYVSVPIEEFQKCLSSFTLLKSLSLVNVKADGMTEKGYEEIFSALPTLFNLTIRDQLFITGQIICTLPKNLSNLSLGPYFLAENSLHKLMVACPCLRQLNVEGCTIYLNDLKYFCERSPLLTYLNISNVLFKIDQNYHQSDLLFIGLLQRLEELHASETEIDDDVLRILSLNCDKLQHLCLKSNNIITDVGMIHLSKLKHLKILDLSNNSNINDWSIGHLISMNENLQRIFVCNSKNLHGSFLSLALSRCSSLEFVSFCRCKNVNNDVLNACSSFLSVGERKETKVIFKLNIHETNITIANVFANQNLQRIRLDFDDTDCDEHHGCCTRFNYDFFN